ncbi:hypothetical protein EMIT0111MI5_20442 [Burkholderia sp. IT-111MI5]
MARRASQKPWKQSTWLFVRDHRGSPQLIIKLVSPAVCGVEADLITSFRFLRASIA